MTKPEPGTQVVYKYVVHPHGLEDRLEVRMPIRSQVITVGAQGVDVCLWALVDLEIADQTELKRFTVKGTGHPMSEAESELPFLGSVFLDSLGLVFHIWEGWAE